MTRLPLYQPILFYRYLYSIWQYLNIFNTGQYTFINQLVGVLAVYLFSN
jgi:hypothetical protein